MPYLYLITGDNIDAFVATTIATDLILVVIVPINCQLMLALLQNFYSILMT